ncbi:MAG: spore coat protein CotS [Clostridium sp.]
MNDRNTEVLGQYELEIGTLRRGRGAWVCETNQGLKLLREYKGTEKRLEFEEEVLSALQEHGRVRVDQYVRNKENELISVGGDGCRYIVKDWYNDRECNIRDEEEIITTVSRIAALHKIMSRIELKEEWNLGSILTESMAEEMDRHNKELRRTRNFISGKRRKSDFELCVMANFPIFCEQALEAQAGMKRIEEEHQIPAHYLCHGELNQHHVLMNSEYTAIIEFNKMHLGVQAADLYHFIRKAMEKHGWDLNLGMKMLDAYDQILPMGKMEREYLYYLFLYPEKYWKQLNFYYNANKAWIPARNVEKLKNLEMQQKDRNQFLIRIR